MINSESLNRWAGRRRLTIEERAATAGRAGGGQQCCELALRLRILALGRVERCLAVESAAVASGAGYGCRR